MKKIRFILLALTLCALCAEAGAQTVTVADVEALPGETVAFTLNLAGGRADTYIAMQFDAQFPVTGFSTTGDYSISSSWKNATSVIGSVDANGVATIPVSSAETITGSDVDGLLTVYFTVDNNVALGSYEVTLKNLWFGYGTSSKDYLDDVTFYVNVVERHTIVLDETSTIAPEAATGVNVLVKRTIKADVWNTICLPFDMTEAQVKSAFGDDVELADFIGIESTKDADDDDIIVSISVNFDEASAIEANHPYLIKVSAPVSEFSVENVNIDSEEEPSVDKDKLTIGTGKKTQTYYNRFVGTYVANTVVPNMCLFLNDNKFYYSTGTTKMKGFRGYFDFYDVLSDVEDELDVESKIRLVFDSGATAINEISTPKVLKGAVYNMNGQLIGTDIDINNLPKGVYMIDGKKVAIY